MNFVGLESGDEIVVTNQDHEANSGAWRAAAKSVPKAVGPAPVEPALFENRKTNHHGSE